MIPRLIAASLLPVAACALQWVLWDYISPSVWFLFFPPPMPAPGSAASGAAWRGRVSPPYWSGMSSCRRPSPYALDNPSAGLSILIFLVMGTLFAVFFERLRWTQARSETRFEAVFEQASVGMAYIGLNGRWLRVNDTFCRIVGYDRTELSRLRSWELTHPDDRKADRDGARRLLVGEWAEASREKRCLHKDGRIRWIRLSVVLVRKPKGASDYFVVIIEDIQARKEAEEAMRKSEELLQSFFENAASLVWVKDLDGRFLRVNPFAERLFGWRAEEVIGQPVSVLVPEQDSAGTDLSRLVAEIASHPDRYRNNINENICRDGRRLWMSWTNRALRDAGGQVIHILAIGNDMTERRQAEEDLRLRNDELEQLQRASVGRELAMIGLKRQINALSQALGREPPFDLSFAETADVPAGSPLP